jgi:hypothetical protein
MASGAPHSRNSRRCFFFRKRFFIVASSFPDVAVNRGVCHREGLTAGNGLSIVWVWGRVNHACNRMRLPTVLGYEMLGKSFSS